MYDELSGDFKEVVGAKVFVRMLVFARHWNVYGQSCQSILGDIDNRYFFGKVRVGTCVDVTGIYYSLHIGQIKINWLF